MKKILWILLALIVIAVIMSKKIRNKIAAMIPGVVNAPFSSDTSKRIYIQARKRGAGDLLARIMVAWSKWESGNFGHHFARDYNAYFGYSRDPNSKWQSGGGTKADNGAAIGAYRSLEDSVNEVYDFLYRRFNRQDRGKFPEPNSIASTDELASLLQQSAYGSYGSSSVRAGLKKYFSSNV